MDLLAIRHQLAGNLRQMPDYCYLQERYRLRLTASDCPKCAIGKLLVLRTQTRLPISLTLAAPKVIYYEYACSDCGHALCTNEWLDEYVEPGHKYGYDLMCAIGLQVVVAHRGHEEVQQALWSDYRIRVPLNSIHDQVVRFLNFFATVHEQNADRLRQELLKDAWFLSVDGTSELETDTIFAAIATYQCDESGPEEAVADASDTQPESAAVPDQPQPKYLILGARRMRSETTNGVLRLLLWVVELFGAAPAVLSDLSTKIEGAVKSALPKAGHFICHFHFLENVGEKALKERHQKLQSLLTKSSILRYFESKRHDLQRATETAEQIDASWLDDVPAALSTNNGKQNLRIRRCLAYLGMKWVSDYRSDLKGEHFPFELPALALYDRLQAFREQLEIILNGTTPQTMSLRLLSTILIRLRSVVDDPHISQTVQELRESQELFTQLRVALRLNVDNRRGLRRNRRVTFGTRDLRLSRERLNEVRADLETHVASCKSSPIQKETAQVILGYLNKYHDRLVQNSIVVTDSGVSILVPRTNWISEHRFSLKKTHWRKRTGNKQLRRCLQACEPEEFLTANLDNPDYTRLLYNNDISPENLATTFSACADAAASRRKAKEQNQEPTIKISRPLLGAKALARIIDAMKALAS